MEERDLNRYFFDALQRLFNLPTSTYVSGSRIWPYELPWATKMVTRLGYLFFGPPNERSTAQPPRDFYLYFLPPFGAQYGRLAGTADEVILLFQGQGSDFQELVRQYAGAQAMAAESPNYRQVYEDKASEHLRTLLGWSRQNFSQTLRISHQGVTRSVPEILAQTRSSASRDAEDLLRLIASHLLEPHFRDDYPEYPAFTGLTQPITESGRSTSAQDAIRFLARRNRTALAIGVLDGLKLLNSEERITPLNSPYARYFLDLLLAKGETQVVNHGEVIEQVASGVLPVYKDQRFKLEPEWVVVILLALVYDGQITLSFGGNEVLDAGNIERAALKTVNELTDFRFYRRPRELPLPVWARIFERLGLQASLVRDEGTRDEAIRQLQSAVSQELSLLAMWQNTIQNRLSLWSMPLFTDQLSYQVQGGVVTNINHQEVLLSQTDLLPHLRKTKEFLEQLARFDTPGKLRNLTITLEEAEKALSYRDKALLARQVLETIDQLRQQTAYLSEASAVLPDTRPWASKAETARQELLTEVRRLAKGEGQLDIPAWRRRLENLRGEYLEAYSELHRHSVLGPSELDQRARLLHDQQLEQLQELARIDILNEQEVVRWRQSLEALPGCREFHEGLLDVSPICPRCNFRPVQIIGQSSAASRLRQLEEQLGVTLKQWHDALRQNLMSETARQSIEAMTMTERRSIEAYLSSADTTGASLLPGLVQAINQALRGLTTIPLHADDLLAAFQDGGLPCTVEEFAERFQRFLQQALSGHDRRSTRLTITQEKE